MIRSTMDLYGLYNYYPDLLNDFVIPEELNRDDLIDNLLLESAELEILYPDAPFFQKAIGVWSRKMLHIWEEQLKTTQYDYNPIWNKDGTVTEVETRDLKGTEDVQTNIDRTDDLKDNNIRDTVDTETRDFIDKEVKDLNGDNLNSVYGFNANTAAPASKDAYTDKGSDTLNHTGTGTMTRTGTDTIEHTGRQDIDTKVDRDTTDTGTIKHERIEQGNIGLTSTQDLINQQREVVKFNIYDVIIKDFIGRFCLGVY